MASKSFSGDLQELRNAVKTLYANIRFASIDNPVHSLVITSSVPNEGKSSVSIELGRAMAEGGKRVLLMDCDMRNRSLAGALNVHPRNGMYAVMSGEAHLKDALVSAGTPNLDFLDVEPHIPNPVDVISSRRFSELLAQLNERYDYVILDTPPVGTFVDGAILSSLADATALVVRLNYTKRDEVLLANEQLEKAHAHLIGVIATFAETGSSSRYSYYYSDDNRAPLAAREHAGDAKPPTPAVLPKKRTAAAQAAPQAKAAPAAMPKRRTAAPQQDDFEVITSVEVKEVNPYGAGQADKPKGRRFRA